MAESLGQATVDLIANTGGFEAGMDRAARKMQSVSKEAAYQGSQMEKLLGSLDPLRRAQNDLSNAQAKLAKGFADGVIGPKTYAKYTDIVRQKVEALNTSAANLAVGLGKAGVSLGQTNNALRQLPAQFTDIFTSLAGGQNPLLVLIQQGGQIKDSFGGIGPMFDVLGQKLGKFLGLSGGVAAAGAALGDVATGARAVGEGAEAAGEGLGSFAEGANTAADAAKNAKEATAALNAVTPPLGIGLGAVLGIVVAVAAATAALAVAYKQGSAESSGYANALAATGNTAGTTAAQLSVIAQAVSDSNGTVHEAAESLAQLAASTRIPVESFQMIATAAANFSDATGKAASETISNFEKIAKDPTKAVLALNESMNFLTVSTYDQISSLEKQGKTQEAATLASETYATALNGVADKVKQNLGTLEGAWKDVSDQAKLAWDSMLAVGRDKSFAEQLKVLDERIAKFREQGVQIGGSFGKKLSDDAIAKLEAEKTQLLVAEEENNRRARAKGALQQTKADALEAGQYLDKINADVSDKQSQREKARAQYMLNVEKLRAGVAGGTVSADDPRLNAERIAKDIDNINAKYADKKAARVKAYVEDAGAKELDQARQTYAALQAQSMAIGTQEGSTRKIGAAAQELAKWEQQIADIKTKGTLTAAQKSLLADEAAITAQKKQNAALEAQNVQREKAAASAQKLLSLEQQLNDELQNVQSGFDQQMAGVGLGDEARKRLQDDLKIREDYQKKLEQLNRDYRKIQNPTAEDTAAYEAQNAVIKSALERRLDIQKNYYAAEDEAQASWSNGALQALNTYMESANDIAAQSRTLVANSLSGIEDAFVKLATDGKLSFKSLADSIIADLARIAAKTLVVQPLLASLTSGGGGVLSGVLGSSGAGGSGGSGQLLGVLDAAGKSISLATSGFGQAVAAGYTAGEGLIGGIQGAFSSGAGYISNSITSAFATGSSTAASVIAQSTATNTGYQLGGSLVSGEVGSATYATSAASSGISSANVVTAAIAGFIQGYKANGVKGGVAAAGGAVGGMYAGAQAGSYFGPIGTAAGAVIGTIVGAAFGSSIFAGEWQTKDQGIQVGVQGGMLEAANYEFQKKKGGLFHSNKKRTNLTALDPGLQKALDDSYNGTLGTVLGLFDALNVELNDGVLDGLNIATKQISTKGKTSDQIQTELTAWFTDLGNAAIGAVDSALGGVGLGGQTVESLTTLVNGLFTVNNVLANLNVGIYDVSVAGAFMAEQLANMSGGLEKFTEASAAYYDKFFSDVEKADDVLKAVGVQFAAVGVGLPATRQGFRDLVEALDITTESGRQMYSVLIGLSGNAAAAYDILEQRQSDYYAILEQRQSDYYGAFYSESENTARTIAETTAQIKEMGVTLPDSRDGFRDMVEALDRTTDTGKAMYDTLMSVAGAASTVFDELDRRLNQGVTDSFSGVQRSIAAQQKAATAAYNATNTSLSDMSATAVKSVTDLSSVSNSLESALKSLRGTSDDAVKTLRAQAQATLQSALATARAGGSLSGFSGLEDALDTVSSNNTDLYGSLEDFNRDQGRTANVVAELNAINGKQLTAAEKLQKSLEDQIGVAKSAYDAQMAQFDKQLEFAQAQMDAFNGIDTSVKSVEAAIKAMNASVVAALGAISFPAASNTPQNNGSIVDTLYQSVLGRDANDTTDAAGKAQWAGALQNGSLSYADAAKAIAEAALAFSSDGYTGDVSQATIASSKAAAQKYLDSLKVPGFARGTNYWDGGPALMGEFGPELVMPNGGATVYNAQNTSRLLSDSGPSAAEVSDASEQKRKTDQRWDRLLRYTEYLERGFINGFPTVEAG